MLFLCGCVFFFKQKTAYEMRISDWSSDVCSSDLKQYPQVIATLDLNNRVVDLVSENYDVAIRTGHLSDSRLIGRRIGSRKLYLCATPDYLEKHGVPSDINDLKYHACIQGTADVWHFIVDDKLVDFRPKGPLRVNSGTAVADAALASRSEEHTSELQSLMRTSYAVFCLKKQNKTKRYTTNTQTIIQ